jgi:hypothetical protein
MPASIHWLKETRNNPALIYQMIRPEVYSKIKSDKTKRGLF